MYMCIQLSTSFILSCHFFLILSSSLLDDLSRNRVPTSADTDLEKACYSIPWSPSEYLSLSDPLWAELDSISPPPMPERCGEQLPDNIPMAPPTPALPYKVYCDIVQCMYMYV